MLIIILFLFQVQAVAGIGDRPDLNYVHNNHVLKHKISCRDCHKSRSASMKATQKLCHKCHVELKHYKKRFNKKFDCTKCHDKYPTKRETK